MLFLKNTACLAVLFCVIGLASVARGQSYFFPNTKLNFHQTLYSGDAYKSFGEARTGVGVELQVFMDGDLFVPYVKGRATTIAGRQKFMDGTTEIQSSFAFYQGQADLGVYLFPVRRRKSGFNVYLGAAGTFGYNYIALDKNETLTTIPHSDQGVSGGYSASIGGEWILTKESRNKWTLNAELAYRSESTVLLKQPRFNLSGVTVSAGIGW